MTKIQLALLLCAIAFSANGNALSPAAETGKQVFATCNACHDQALNPPKGPPMWGVQRRYKKHSPDDEAFVENVVNFVKSPSLERALNSQAVAQLGLMPAMPMPDSMLRNIAAYILEEKFPPPCDHWKIAITRAEEKGDMAHAQKDQNMFKKFCSQP
ncbi:MAG: c-type cytochrome [Gammaproteobacteria bacterium]|nr:c-type cytochrome [Gammaproteobacteria bacterium]